MAAFRKRGAYWQAQIIRKGYPAQYRTFDTKAFAESWVRQIEGEMDRGIFTSRFESEHTTLEEALHRYADEVTSRKRGFAQEVSRIKRWHAHPLAKRFLASLRGADFAKFRDDRRTMGAAENTIRLDLAVISHLFETARKEWGMEALQNPLKNIKKPQGSAERDRRLAPTEYQRLVTQFREQSRNPWILPAFELAIDTALRQEKLLALRWEWINLERRLIQIPSEHRGVGNKGVPASLPLTIKVTEILSTLPRSIDGRVFPIASNALRLAFKRACQRAEISGLRWHDLRHEATSRLFEKGFNAMEVSSITGHKTLQMLKRYTHLNAEDLLRKLG